MTGTITELRRDRGCRYIAGDDREVYLFYRTALQDAWFHELRTGHAVTFEPGDRLQAKLIRVAQVGRD